MERCVVAEPSQTVTQYAHAVFYCILSPPRVCHSKSTLSLFSRSSSIPPSCSTGFVA
jgi:hypothetical protein